MQLKVEVHSDWEESAVEMLTAGATRAEHAVAQKAMTDTEPYVPMLTGSLNTRTRVVNNAIVYPGPYARYLYYGKVMVDSETGRTAMHFTDKDGNEVFRHRKGAKLVPIDRDLKINRSHHRLAQSHWFEASKAQNLDKWVKEAKKAMKNGK